MLRLKGGPTSNQMERGSPRSDCGWNVRDSNGEGRVFQRNRITTSGECRTLRGRSPRSDCGWNIRDNNGEGGRRFPEK